MDKNRSLVRAETLDDFHLTLEGTPLRDPEELEAFYYAGLNAARGRDNVPRLQSELSLAHGRKFFRAFLAGHSGCGKSTELARLRRAVQDGFKTVRFSAREEMHSSSAQPFDVLIVMMIRLVEEMKESGLKVPDQLLDRAFKWFGTEKETHKTAIDTTGSMAAGLGMDADTVWGKVFGMFMSLKGEVKYSSSRQHELVEYRMRRISELMDLMNDFIRECNQLLAAKSGQEWLFIGEDFEKLSDSRLPRTFFVTESALFEQLQTHLIFTIPVDLAWAEGGASLPFPVYAVYDTPVYTKDGAPHDDGRTALRGLLDRRINTDLFEAGQLDRIVVASGGHLRDLFWLAREPSATAVLESPSSATVRPIDAEAAISKLRWEALMRLGTGPHDPNPIPYPEKAKRLKSIYLEEPDSNVPDDVLHSLFRARAVQQFNGRGRFAVPPLVVDILINQKVIEPGSRGGLL